MPKINFIRKPKKERTEVNKTEARELRHKNYNRKVWRDLRLTYLKNNPLCAECLKEGRVTAAEDIHHKISPFNYQDMVCNDALFLDPDNLEALCKFHHSLEHKKNSGYIPPEEIIKTLDEFFADIPDD